MNYPALQRLERLRAAAKLGGQDWREYRHRPSSGFDAGQWTVAPYTEERRRDIEPKTWRWIEGLTRADLLRYVGDAVVERRPYAEPLTQGRDGGAMPAKGNGWYTDNWQSDTTAGVVFQLAGKGGAARYVAGVRDPWNADQFCIDFGETFDDEKEAAGRADQYAELFAEFCRDDDAKQQAEAQIEDIGEELATLRREVRQALREYRQASATIDALPALRSALCKSLESMLRERADLFKRRETLRENYWESVPNY